MPEQVFFVPRSRLNAASNLSEFIDFIRTRLPPLLACNNFDDFAWSMKGLGAKGASQSFIYFSRLGVVPRARKRTWFTPANLPEEELLREPFRTFAKAMIVHMHAHHKSKSIQARMVAFRCLESALFEFTPEVCPTLITPEVMNRATNLIMENYSESTIYNTSNQLRLIYRNMVELELLAVPSEWHPSVPTPRYSRDRVGKEFDNQRLMKLPSPLALKALSEIFNSGNCDTKETFITSVCALMLCAPDRSAEMLFAPMNLIGPDWVDPVTGEVGTTLRWFPVKNGAPLTKTVIPSMRDIAIKSVNQLIELSEPARNLARWYESNPQKIYLPPNLAYLRDKTHITLKEAYWILFGENTSKLTNIESNRIRNWIKAHKVFHTATLGKGIIISFSALEHAVLALLPEGFPVMDAQTNMPYSKALCISLHSETRLNVSRPMTCCFNRIKYSTLQHGLKSHTGNKSIFERRNYTDENGQFLSLTTHQLRHYLNTLIRNSNLLTEEEIARWSGRNNPHQNAIYNHESDRDVVAKIRAAIGEPSRGVGPLANIDNRNLIRRDEFLNVKIITAHTTQNGYCLHDFAQMPCQVAGDCMNCDEHVCIKGDLQAEQNIRSLQIELTQLQEAAREAFSTEVLGAAEWYHQQTKTLERVNQLIAILDDPEVPQGAVIQLSGVIPPSRIEMAQEERKLIIKPISKSITSINDVHALLTISVTNDAS